MRDICQKCKYEQVMAQSLPCCDCTGSMNFVPMYFEPKPEKTMRSEYKVGQAVPYAPEELERPDPAPSRADMLQYAHPLYEAYDDAVKQATKGKGERHGGDKIPFMDQPWHNISRHTGVGGLIFQMVKKAQEACGKDDQEAFERELLGALVYGGAAYLYVKQHGFKK